MNANKVPQEFEWTDKAIADFWDYAANSVLMRLSFSKMWGPKLAELIAEIIPEDKTICDYGAGSGDMIKELLKLGYKVGAYETSEERKNSFSKDITGNPNFLGFHIDIKYDCVICFEVLEHLKDEYLESTLRKIDEILRDDGVFIGSTPWDENLHDNYCLCPACHALFHRWQHMRSFNPETMAELLLSHGFTPVEIFRASFMISLIFIARKTACVKKQEFAVLEQERKGLPEGVRPVSISRFEQIQKAKYARELTQEEIEDYLSWMYHANFGIWPNFVKPGTYNEKLNWLKIHYHNPKLHVIVDKARFHSYVLTKMPGYEDHCVKQLALFRKPSEFTNEALDKLPDRFVLKSNVGSGAQEFVDKEYASIGHIQQRIGEWLNPLKNHYFMALEWCYKDVPQVVLCEPVIEFEYKIEFYCFDGQPFIYWIVKNDKTADVHANIYDMNGNKLPVSWHYPNFDEEMVQPPYFDELVNAAKRLSKGFPHVRVDFYAAKDTWYFSEMTFYTWAGIMPFSDPAYDIMLGKKIDLEGICA